MRMVQGGTDKGVPSLWRNREGVRMTPARRAADTANKRAERQRRKEAGEVRVETWFAADEAEWLKGVGQRGNMPVSEAVRWCVCIMMEQGR